MKKTISIFTIFAILIVSVFCVYATGNNADILSINDVDSYGFSEEITQMIKNKIQSGGTIYKGEGTTTPDYLKTRSISSTIVNLPGPGATFDFEMENGNTYYSPFTFKANSSCTMKIHRTASWSYEPCNINLKIKTTLGNTVFNADLNVPSDGTTLSFPITAGEQYYLVTEPLDSGESYIAYYVYGE